MPISFYFVDILFTWISSRPFRLNMFIYFCTHHLSLHICSVSLILHHHSSMLPSVENPNLSLASCSPLAFRSHRSLTSFLVSQPSACPLQSLFHIVPRVIFFKMCDPLPPVVKKHFLVLLLLLLKV